MDRELDGIYFRVERDGKWGSARFTDLVIENDDGDEARFKIDYCPFCGRNLVSDHADR